MNAKNHDVGIAPTTPPPLPGISKAASLKKRRRGFGNDVFIIHGNDETAKTTVARFLDKLGLNPTIFHEELHNGQPAPGKFKRLANDADFAIVLLTDDDVGAEKDKPAQDLMPRAREDVIFELGYFWGELGHERVCVLYKEGIELPSGIQELGVPLENTEAWQTRLTREMKQAGLPVNSDKARDAR